MELYLNTKLRNATQRVLKNKIKMKDQIPFGKAIQSGMKLVVLEIDIKITVAEKSQLERLKKFMKFTDG